MIFLNQFFLIQFYNSSNRSSITGEIIVNFWSVYNNIQFFTMNLLRYVFDWNQYQKHFIKIKKSSNLTLFVNTL